MSQVVFNYQPKQRDPSATKKKDKSTESAKIRSKYPQSVPVICIDKTGLGYPSGVVAMEMNSQHETKLLVPKEMKGASLRKIIYSKTQWDETGVLMVGTAKLPDDSSVGELDRQHKANDGMLYISRHLEPASSAVACAELEESKQIPESSAKAIPEDGAVHPSVVGSQLTETHEIGSFHLPDQDPEGDSSMLSDTLACENGKLSKVTKILKKHPNRVPIRCKQEATPELGLPSFDKKLLAPSSMMFSEFKGVAQRYVPLSTEGNAQLVLAGVALEIDAPLSELYEEYKEADGLLYMTYALVTKPCGSIVDARRDIVTSVDAEEDASMKQKVIAELEQEIQKETSLQQKQIEDLRTRLQESEDARVAAQEETTLLRHRIADMEAERQIVTTAAAVEVADLKSQLEEVRAERDISSKAAEHELEEYRSREKAMGAQLNRLMWESGVAAADLTQLRSQFELVTSERDSAVAVAQQLEGDLAESRACKQSSEQAEKLEERDRELRRCAQLAIERETKLARVIEESTGRWEENQKLRAEFKEMKATMQQTIMDREGDLKEARAEALNMKKEMEDGAQDGWVMVPPG